MKKSWSAPQLSDCKRFTPRTMATPPYTMMTMPANPLEEMAVYRTTISSLLDCHTLPAQILNKEDEKNIVTCMMTPIEPPEEPYSNRAADNSSQPEPQPGRRLRRRRLRKLIAL